MELIKKLLCLCLLLVSNLVYSQTKSEAFVDAFETYQKVWPGMHVHMVFNQEKFVPGDTVYFKAYLLGDALQPIEDKQILDVDLVGKAGESLAHTSFNIEKGIGFNQLIVPQELPAGAYWVTAYTNWMKNFGEKAIYRKRVTIIRENEIALNDEIIKAKVEGGSLIAGVSAKVVFLTSQPHTRVNLVDQSGQSLGSATSGSNGFGTIEWLPKLNSAYFLKVAEGSASLALEPVQGDGVGLRLAVSEPGNAIMLTVSLANSSRFANKKMFAVITGMGEIYSVQPISLVSNEAKLNIDPTPFPEGRLHLSILTEEGVLLASRDFYGQQPQTSVHAELTIASEYIAPRSLVKLDVALTDALGNPIEGEFSVKVLNEAVLETKENSLADELRIFSHDESILLEKTKTDWLSNLDAWLVLNTQPVDWPSIMKENSFPNFGFSSMIQKSGTALYAKNKQPLPEGTKLMFYLQKDQMRYEVVTQAKGNFNFNILDIYGEDEMLIMAELPNGEELLDLDIVWNKEDAMHLPIAPKTKELENLDAYAQFKRKDETIRKSFGFFSMDQAIDSTWLRNQPPFDLMEPDNLIIVDDYDLFSTMEEFILEVVRPLRVDGNIKKVVRLKFLNPTETNGDPLYIIDGIATKNTGFFLSLNPTELETIGVVKYQNKLTKFGSMGRNGIVIVESKKGGIREPQKKKNLLLGLSHSMDFAALNFENNTHPEFPEFKSTIFWVPTLTTNKGKASVTFYASDDLAPIHIRIDGMASGKPFTVEKIINIRIDQNH